MIKLALIGKNISHSQSPKIYKQLLGDAVNYDLLDYSSSSLIPSAKELLKTYVGVSITAPYKEHFLKEAVLTVDARDLNAINCLYLDKKGTVNGDNTDYLAMLEIVKRDLVDKGLQSIVILGDGAMARVTAKVLDSYNWPYEQLSRKKNGPLENLDLIKSSLDSQLVIINCCSRNFSFRGRVAKGSLYWNLNYAQKEEENALENMGLVYQDGQELLYLQAKYALAKWQLEI